MQYSERLLPGRGVWKSDMSSHAQRYRFASQFVKGKRVLDAGCGVGYGARMLAIAGASEVVAVDISDEALAEARTRFSHARVRFICDDCETLAKVEPRFDVVVSLENLEHLREPQKFLARTVALLDASGVLICSTPRGSMSGVQTPSNPYHVREFSASEFRSLMLIYFSDVMLMGQDFSAAMRTAQVLWSNPFVRLGRFLQQFRGRRLQPPLSDGMPLTEADLSISEFDPEDAWTLLAICRAPLR